MREKRLPIGAHPGKFARQSTRSTPPPEAGLGGRRPAKDTPSPEEESSSEDPYDTLGISENATYQEIVAARARLVREVHPDKGKVSSSDDFIKVHRAFQKLQERHRHRSRTPRRTHAGSQSAGSHTLAVIREAGSISFTSSRGRRYGFILPEGGSRADSLHVVARDCPDLRVPPVGTRVTFTRVKSEFDEVKANCGDMAKNVQL